MSAVAVNTNRLAPIFFKDFAKFLDATGNNTRKAEFLSRLYHYTKISKFKLNGLKCFTRSISTLATDSNISKSTVSSYLKEFEEKGLIERRNVLCKKKRLYIRVTNFLYSTLGIKCSSNTQNRVIENPKIGLSIYKVKYDNKRSNLSNTSITANSDSADSADILKTCNAQNNDFDLINDLELSKPSTEELADSYAEYEQQPQTKEKIQLGKSSQPQAPKQAANPPRKPVEQEITKTLTKTQKKYVKSVTRNLGAQIKITKPEKLTKEIEQAIINPKRFSKSKSFKHKVNAIAKTIRSGHWHAPIAAVNDNSGSPDAFKVVHVSRDEDGHNLIEVEQSQTKQAQFSPEDQIMQDRLNEIFERTQAERFKL